MTRAVVAACALGLALLLCERVLLLSSSATTAAPPRATRPVASGPAPVALAPRPDAAGDGAGPSVAPRAEARAVTPHPTDDGCDCGAPGSDDASVHEALDRRALLAVAREDASPLRRALALATLEREAPGLDVEVAALEFACAALVALERAGAAGDALWPWEEVARVLGGGGLREAAATLLRASPAARASIEPALRAARASGDEAARRGALEALALLDDPGALAALALDAPPAPAPPLD